MKIKEGSTLASKVYLADFYNNWYFYQVYKDKAHYPQAHNIRYE